MIFRRAKEEIYADRTAERVAALEEKVAALEQQVDRLLSYNFGARMRRGVCGEIKHHADRIRVVAYYLTDGTQDGQVLDLQWLGRDGKTEATGVGY